MAPHVLGCPFCSFEDADEYFLTLHIEELHTENSPFAAAGDSQVPSSSDSNTQLQEAHNAQHDEDDRDSQSYVECPYLECGEILFLSSLNEHLDFHLAERVTLEDDDSSSISPSARMHSSPASSIHQQQARDTSVGPRSRRTSAYETPTKSPRFTPSSASIRRDNDRGKAVSHALSAGKEPGRLGRNDLGPYAFEGRMPDWLWKKLSDGPKITKHKVLSSNGGLMTQESVENETPGLVATLAQLSALDHNVVEAWFCHPAVLHVSSLPKEGGFCGYRNIQMLVSYLQGSKAFGHDKFSGRVPTIPTLQDGIEQAWDMGINAHGRRQTGGIRGTRKYIGTPEVQALFESVQIPSTPDSISSTASQKAYEVLLDSIQAYFQRDTSEVANGANDRPRHIHRTCTAPVYLQEPGHSVTIVGLERLKDGSRNLLVFDPIYRPPPALVKLSKEKRIKSAHPSAMEACRRGKKQLEKHKIFEIISFTAREPRLPAWGIIEAFPETDYVYVFFDLNTNSYDVYAADAFKPTFPWFMFAGLFIVRDGRLASVPGDASLDRLGVPALSVDCDWTYYMKDQDITPLVLAAANRQARQEPQEDQQCHTIAPTDEELPSPVMSPPFAPRTNPELACACLDCLQDAVKQSLWKVEQLKQGFAQYNASQLCHSNQISPLTLSPASSSSPNYSYNACVPYPSVPSYWFNGQSQYQPYRRNCYKRRHYEQAFPTARAFLNGGTPLSKASKAYIKSSSPAMSSPSDANWSNASPSRPSVHAKPFTPANSPSLWKLEGMQWSSASSYEPATPYSSLVSGDSMMPLLPSSPLAAMSGNMAEYSSPLTQYTDLSLPPRTKEASSDTLDWKGIQADMVAVEANGGAYNYGVAY